MQIEALPARLNRGLISLWIAVSTNSCVVYCTYLLLTLIISTTVCAGVRFCPILLFTVFHPLRWHAALIIAVA